MKTIPINEASGAQLRYHAETVLGLEVHRTANRGQMIAKIEQAAPNTATIQVEDEPESPAQAKAETIAADAAVSAVVADEQRKEETKSTLHGLNERQAAQHHHDPKIEIKVLRSPEPGGDRDVPVAVNGQQFLLKRDVFTPVPYRVFEALQNASQTLYDPVTDEQTGRIEPVAREVPSYAFQTRNEPSEEEVQAWRKRTASVELA